MIVDIYSRRPQIMTKKYYIKMNERLMSTGQINSTEKIFIAFLEVLTDKGTSSIDKSNTFFGEKMGKGSSYISLMIKKLASMGLISIGRQYGRRTISIKNPAVLIERGFITGKRKR